MMIILLTKINKNDKQLRGDFMKCFYHSSDLDGHCSGVIIKQKYPKCEMIGINYGQDFPYNTVN